MTKGSLDYVELEHDSSLDRLAGLIHEHCGIDYKGNLHSLAVKAGARMKELGMTCRQYIEHLEQDPAEWDALIEAVTINETYFFREEQQLEELVRLLQAYDGQGEIRIWSAACSTGEEPYSLAMAIQESGMFPLSKVRIYASDINRKVLRTARHGFYPKHSMCFRRTPEWLREKYFDAVQGGYRIQEHIRERVQFFQFNLTRQAAGMLPEMDFIFCRNVLIYFDTPVVQKVISNLADCLSAGGYLFLGHAETIPELPPDLRMINAASTFYYRKEGGSI
jgi:chemotaxis protein methyltransferase CheR